MADVKIYFDGGINCSTALSGGELDKFVARLDNMREGTITIEGSPKMLINVAKIALVEIT